MADDILAQVLAGPVPKDGGSVVVDGMRYDMRGGVLRQANASQSANEELSDFYHKHWTLEGAYDTPASDEYQAEVFTAMFGDNFTKLARAFPAKARVLDVGCGSGVAGRVYFGPVFDRVDYVGVDMSRSIEQAQKEFADRKLRGAFVQAEIATLPFNPASFDYVFCPGVLHYTRNLGESVAQLARHLKPKGSFITWVYKQQKPVRRLTDRLLRDHFSRMTPEQAFEAMKPLTKLGIALGEAKAKITVSEDIPVLEIDKGEYDVQRFVYYFIMKLFYHPELTFTRHNVNNWNAYYPRDVLFPSLDEVRAAFAGAGLDIAYMNPQGNGVAVVAQKP